MGVRNGVSGPVVDGDRSDNLAVAPVELPDSGSGLGLMGVKGDEAGTVGLSGLFTADPGSSVSFVKLSIAAICWKIGPPDSIPLVREDLSWSEASSAAVQLICEK